MTEQQKLMDMMEGLNVDQIMAAIATSRERRTPVLEFQLKVDDVAEDAPSQLMGLLDDAMFGGKIQ